MNYIQDRFFHQIDVASNTLAMAAAARNSQELLYYVNKAAFAMGAICELGEILVSEGFLLPEEVAELMRQLRLKENAELAKLKRILGE
jgi:hypothetical protein